MLQTLTDMKITTKILSGNSDEGQEEQVDLNYKKLNCGIERVDPSSEEYKLIHQYIEDGRESFKPKIIDIFTLDR